jgi:integrase
MGMIRRRKARNAAGELVETGPFWIKYYRDGRPYEESTHTTEKRKAQKILRLRESQCDQGLPVTPQVNRLRFEDAAKALVTEYTINGRRSLTSLEARIDKGLKPYFRGRRLANISTTDVEAYCAHRLTEDQMSHATINRELAALKRMFTLAFRAGKILHRPYIPMLQEDNARKGFFEAEAFASVYAHLPKESAAVALFAYLTGWRVPSEVLTLQWPQVDRTACTVRLEPGTTKNRQARVFHYKALDTLKNLIEAQWAEHDRLKKTGKIVPWVFHRAGVPIHNFRRAWLTACTRAGCPGRIPHDLRRTAVRNMVRAGIPERVAMTMTGHKTRSVFERYNIVSEADLSSAAEKLNAAQTVTISVTVDDQAKRQRKSA